MAIYTAGYEGLSIDAFIARLSELRSTRFWTFASTLCPESLVSPRRLSPSAWRMQELPTSIPLPWVAQNRFETAIRSMAIGGSMRATSGLTSVPGWTFWRT